MNIEERKQHLLEELRALKIVKVVIEYSGSGDSGQVDTVSAYREGDTQPQEPDVIAKDSPFDVPIRVSNAILGNDNAKLSARLEQFAYDALDAADVDDWYNNDGGEGILTILVKTGDDSELEEFDAGAISIRHRTFYTESDCSSFTL